MGSFSSIPTTAPPKCSCLERNKLPEAGGEGIKTLKGVNFHISWLSIPPGRGT